jgi:hypothetical protein
MLDLRRRPYRHHHAAQLLVLGKFEQRADHPARIALGAVNGGHRNGERAEHIGLPILVASGSLDDPVPSLGRQVFRSGAQNWDAVGDRNGVTRFFVDEAELIFRIGVEKVGVMLVMRVRVVEKAEVAPRGVLDRLSSLTQFGAVRPRTDDEFRCHGRSSKS